MTLGHHWVGAANLLAQRNGSVEIERGSQFQPLLSSSTCCSPHPKKLFAWCVCHPLSYTTAKLEEVQSSYGAILAKAMQL